MTPTWHTISDSERVARTRWLCFSHAGKDLPRMIEWIEVDRRAADGDFLLIEEHGQTLATSTSLSMTLWARGTSFPCQGVAFVGAIKSARRRGAARAAMVETLRKAREREQVVTALMPFRVSYYQNFGYAPVERRSEWTIPLSLIPASDQDDWHPIGSADHRPLEQMCDRMVKAGQCDIERSSAGWTLMHLADENGMTFCSSSGWVSVAHQSINNKDHLRVTDWGALDLPGIKSILFFLGTLRDQYLAVTIPLPVDCPVHFMLKESQLPHRPVNHLTAEVRTMTRMQLRILDHIKFLKGLHIPPLSRGGAVIEVAECEGDNSKVLMDCADGHIDCKASSASADFQCADRTWAAIASGALSAVKAAEMGLAQENKSGSAALLDAAFAGPSPFCHEYF